MTPKQFRSIAPEGSMSNSGEKFANLVKNEGKTLAPPFLNAEWDDVEKFIYENRKHFAGISLLSSTGDMDYPQAPFCTVHTPIEIVKEYGDGSLMASGLIVDGLRVFNNNLWAFCDCVLGIGENLNLTDE